MGTEWRTPVRGGGQNLDQLRPIELSPPSDHFDHYGFAGKGSWNERDLAVDARDAGASKGEAVDGDGVARWGDGSTGTGHAPPDFGALLARTAHQLPGARRSD